MFGYVPPVPRMPNAGVILAATPFHGRGVAREIVANSTSTRLRRKRRGVIIDLDDTLYPRDRFVRSGLAAVAKHASEKYGIAADAAYGVMTRSLAIDGNGSELQALCRRFDLPEANVRELLDVFRSHTPSLFLSQEAVDTLHALRADGWALAILTNGLPSVQFRKIAALGITPLVDEVIYAEEHAHGGKPSAAPFQAALHALELTAAQCVCVGDDAARDVRGARNVGMATIRVVRPGAQVALADEADLVIDSVKHIPGAAALLLTRVTADVA